ncbi:hypothetical protein Glove_91g51 [Diversispora epigaea]|uniref:Uncharacterized protein n=1 Tax=Diversispora epigaea TaxID=1348612 RepID=A0A397J7S5_9GLOM|nr:hypothetical protein Glove_91g51 [Diversispora epigaea]
MDFVICKLVKASQSHYIEIHYIEIQDIPSLTIKLENLNLLTSTVLKATITHNTTFCAWTESTDITLINKLINKKILKWKKKDNIDKKSKNTKINGRGKENIVIAKKNIQAFFTGWKNQSSSGEVTEVYLDLLKPFENTNLSWTLTLDGNLLILLGVNITDLTNPIGIIGYSASLLPNGIIVYIGGQESTTGEGLNLHLNSQNYASRPITEVKKDLPPVNMKGRQIMFEALQKIILVLAQIWLYWIQPNLCIIGYSLDDKAHNSQALNGLQLLVLLLSLLVLAQFNAGPSSQQKDPLKFLAIGLGTGISIMIVIFAAIFIFRKKGKSLVLKISGSNDPYN